MPRSSSKRLRLTVIIYTSGTFVKPQITKYVICVLKKISEIFYYQLSESARAEVILPFHGNNLVLLIQLTNKIVIIVRQYKTTF